MFLRRLLYLEITQMVWLQRFISQKGRNINLNYCVFVQDPNLQRTFIMLKPDALQRGLMGKIIERFEDKGFKLVAMKMVWVDIAIQEFILSAQVDSTISIDF